MKRLALCIVLLIVLLIGCVNKNNSDNTSKQNINKNEKENEVKNESEAVDIEMISKNFVADISKEEYVKLIKDYNYSDKLKGVLNEVLLRDKVWKVMIKHFGSYNKIESIDTKDKDDSKMVMLKLDFEKGYIDLIIAFNKQGIITGITQGKTEAKASDIPNGIIEKSIEVGDSVKLPGTLTLPKDEQNYPMKDKDYPIVILVHGSGPNDRDESIGPNKPFRDIAWGLGQKGIATLRYDKRTKVDQGLVKGNYTVNEETVDDAISAVEYLETVEKIDSKRIFILGHSLGGMMTPRIATRTDDIGGYIIMAGAVTPLEDLIVEQAKYLRELDGSLSDDDKKVIKMCETIKNNIKGLSNDSKFVAKDLFNFPISYWLDLKNYKPAEVATTIKSPVLILQGSRDYQVPVREYELWKNSLKNNENVSFKIYDGLNHLFIKGEGVPNPGEYSIPGKVDETVISDIGSWMHGLS